MSALHPRRLLSVAVTTVLAASLPSALTTTLSAEAAPAAPAPAAAGTSSEGDAGDLRIENSFVSDQGWVKPGESYPSRILLTNDGSTPATAAAVTIAAPRGTDFTGASAPAGTSRTSPPTRWCGRSRRSRPVPP